MRQTERKSRQKKIHNLTLAAIETKFQYCYPSTVHRRPNPLQSMLPLFHPPNPPGRRRTQGVLKRVSPTETQFTKSCRPQRQVAEEKNTPEQIVHRRSQICSHPSSSLVHHLGGNSKHLFFNKFIIVAGLPKLA